MTITPSSHQPCFVAMCLILAPLFGPGLAAASDAPTAVPEASAAPEQRPTPCAKPEYPPSAMAARAEGTTVVRMTIAADGTPQKASVERSAGSSREHRLLDRAAVEHLVRCRLGPTKNGEPATLQVEYVWKHGLPAAPASAP